MLTPEKIKAMDAITGLSTPTTDASNKRAEEIRQLALKAQNEPGFIAKMAGGARAVGDFFTQSEQAFGQDIAGGLSAILPKSWTGVQQLDDATKSHLQNLDNLVKVIQIKEKNGDTAGVAKWKGILQDEIKSSPTSLTDLYPALKKTNWQVAGDAAGVLADILSAGTYGKAEAETGKLLVKGGGVIENAATKIGIPTTEKVADVVVKTGKEALGQTLKTIGKETATRSAIGGATGYGYDVVNNMQEGKEGADMFKPGAGTVVGASLPLAIGVIRAGSAVTKDLAPRIVNSLIKPKTSDFAYGKDPGRTVSAMGITGNSLDDFGNDINKAKQEVGSELGKIYDNPANANVRINATDEISKIDKAIADAAEGGKNNQGIVDSLQNIKDSLLYGHAVNAEGQITKVADKAVQDEISLHLSSAIQELNDPDIGSQFTTKAGMKELINRTKINIVDGLRGEGFANAADNIDKLDLSKVKNLNDLAYKITDMAVAPKDLSNLTTKEAFALKQKISNATKFNGTPSDDKAVNATLKEIYGSLKDKLNKAVS